MSVNIVNKTTGELTKVAGNVAPPTDSVTNGDMRPVTSNAVHDNIYDKEHDHVSYTSVSGDTWETMFNKLYALVDRSKLTSKSVLVRTDDSIPTICNLRSIYASALSFGCFAPGLGASDPYINDMVYWVAASSSNVHSLTIRASAPTAWNVTKYSSEVLTATRTYEVWYNGYHQ